MDRQQSMIAVGLEAAPGTIFQTFGIGHLYAGKVGTGLALMVSYWVLQWINLMLTGFFGIGFVTGFLTWLGYMVFSTTSLLDSRSGR
jgi:TM2 domain-containing membrane protein YozV